MHLAVDQQKALAHVFRDCGKLALAQLQLVHLLADGAVLFAQLVKQRRQLRIARQRRRIVRIDGVEGLRDLPRQPVRQHAAENQHQRRHPQKRREQHKNHRRERILRARNAQDGAALQKLCIIKRALQKRLGIARGLCLAGLQRVIDLFAVRVAFQKLRRCGAVIKNGAACSNPRHAVVRREAVKIIAARGAQALSDRRRFCAQPGKRAVFIVAVHDAEKQQRACQQRRDGDQIRNAQDFSRHVPDPSL